MIKHFHDSFGDVKSFLKDEDLPSSRLMLLDNLNNALMNTNLKIELAVTIVAGERFAKATYRLEGDGPLIFTAYEEI